MTEAWIYNAFVQLHLIYISNIGDQMLSIYAHNSAFEQFQYLREQALPYWQKIQQVFKLKCMKTFWQNEVTEHISPEKWNFLPYR